MTKQILLSLLNCSWQWGLLGCLTWLVTRRFRRTNSTTHLLWLLFLLSLPILFALNQFVPALSISSAATELTETQPIEISGFAAQTAGLPEIILTERGTQSQAHTVAESKFFFDWTTTNLILCIWAVGTLAMLIRVAFGLYRIHRLRHTAKVADDSYQAVCNRLAQKLNINRQVTVCFSDRIVSPISFGWLSPYILIPRKLNLEQFELVAAHELAHVQRLDWLTNLFSHVVGAIFFFHPIYYFLNRKLVHLRERICDDWVIQLTGARKNYAQCLLNMVHHKEQPVLLTLGLNQPSQLESRINSILKNNRQLDLQPKRRLLVVAITLLLTCLPLLAMAQLVPLRTVQLSLFAQTPQESEKAVEKVEKKRGEQKKPAKMKDKKEYKKDKSIKVLDPSAFNKSEENRLFSGPQQGEKLPPLKVTGITGEIDGKTFDITAKADGKPLVLFLQDTNTVGIKGLNGVFKSLLKIDAFQKRHSKATGAQKSNQGIQIGVVFLADDLETLPEWAHNMLKTGIPNEVLTGISPDGREGPGSYGLNRNVAQTIIIAKDGNVLHNFAFTQPMLYTDPHLFGAIAQAIEVEPATLEKWLNDKELNRYRAMIAKNNARLLLLKFEKLSVDLKYGMVSKEEAAEQLKKLGITWEEGEELLKKKTDTSQKMDRNDVWSLYEQTVEDLEKVKKELDAIMDGKLLKKKTDTSQKMDRNDVWSLYEQTVEDLEKTIKELETIRNGKLLKKTDTSQKMDRNDVRSLLEQAREDLEKGIKELDAIRNGRLLKEKTNTSQKMDREQYQNQRQVKIADPKNFSTPEEKRIFSGPQPGEKLPPLKATGIRGAAKGKTFDFITKADGQPLVLLLQDESGVGLRGLYDISRMVDKISNESKQELQMSVVFFSDNPAALKQITQHVPENVLVGISPDGREGPGSYGLNRNVSQTVIIAKESKVLYNFAFAQPLLFADPHVLGAIADVIQEKPETVAKWLNQAPAEGERMQGDREQMELERSPSQEELVKRFDKDGDGKLNREEGLAARRALANRENQNRYHNARVEVKNPAEFKKTQKKELFSGPQPGEKLPPLMAKGINGETKDKTSDFIAKADGQTLVLFLQDESGLGLRGLVGVSRLLAQIAEKSKQTMHISAVFLGDTPDTLENQASKLVPHIPSGVLLGISPDGREGTGQLRTQSQCGTDSYHCKRW